MTLITDCMEKCGIREEILDNINDTASNVNCAQDDLAPLVNTFVAGDTVPADALNDITTTSVNNTISLDIEATVLPTDAAVLNDGIQQHPVEASRDIQQDPDQASTVITLNGVEVYNDNLQQHTVEASIGTVPNDIVAHNDEMQTHIVETSEPVEKGITSYVQVIALTILQSLQQQLLVRKIYESITRTGKDIR